MTETTKVEREHEWRALREGDDRPPYRDTMEALLCDADRLAQIEQSLEALADRMRVADENLTHDGRHKEAQFVRHWISDMRAIINAPDAGEERVMRVKILETNERLRVAAGEVYHAERYWLDPRDKVTLLARESDGFDPCCNQYRDEVAYWMDGQWWVLDGTRFVPEDARPVIDAPDAGGEDT